MPNKIEWRLGGFLLIFYLVTSLWLFVMGILSESMFGLIPLYMFMFPSTLFIESLWLSFVLTGGLYFLIGAVLGYLLDKFRVSWLKTKRVLRYLLAILILSFLSLLIYDQIVVIMEEPPMRTVNFSGTSEGGFIMQEVKDDGDCYTLFQENYLNEDDVYGRYTCFYKPQEFDMRTLMKHVDCECRYEIEKASEYKEPWWIWAMLSPILFLIFTWRWKFWSR